MWNSSIFFISSPTLLYIIFLSVLITLIKQAVFCLLCSSPRHGTKATATVYKNKNISRWENMIVQLCSTLCTGKITFKHIQQEDLVALIKIVIAVIFDIISNLLTICQKRTNTKNLLYRPQRIRVNLYIFEFLIKSQKI